MMPRHQDWPVRLHRFIEGRRERPFSVGGNDCLLFCADWILEATGVDPAAEWRGTYDEPIGALRQLRRFGARTLEEAATQALGDPLPAPAFAQRGDIVSVESEGEVALGICIGAEIILVGPAGFATLPLARGRKAWRV